MDATEKLILQSKASAVVLGRAEQFVLIPLDVPLARAALDLAKARGYAYAGVLCVIDGHVEIEGPERELLLLAAVPFAEYVAAKATPKSDALDWLEKLYRLEDTRN